MVVYLIAALLLAAIVGIVFGLHQIGAEQAVTFHHGAIKLQEIETFGSLVQIIAHAVRVEHVRKLVSLSRILHRSLMETAQGLLSIAHPLIEHTAQKHGRSRLVGMLGDVGVEGRKHPLQPPRGEAFRNGFILYLSGELHGSALPSFDRIKGNFLSPSGELVGG